MAALLYNFFGEFFTNKFIEFSKYNIQVARAVQLFTIKLDHRTEVRTDFDGSEQPRTQRFVAPLPRKPDAYFDGKVDHVTATVSASAWLLDVSGVLRGLARLFITARCKSSAP